MNHFIAGILKSFILEALAATLVMSALYERVEQRRRFDIAFGIIAVLAVAAFVNFGAFHPGREGPAQYVHTHEQFHFHFGSKFLTEVRYDAIYDAATLALWDDPRTRREVRERRDPLTFEMARGALPEERAAEVRARFTDARWEAYVTDLQAFRSELGLPIGRALNDHGNTGSPTWAMSASLLTNHLPVSMENAALIGNLDLVLLTILFGAMVWAFGPRSASIGITICCAIPIVYDWLGGSILRFDWFVALGLAICLFEKQHFLPAGALLGYAVASKLLAGVMVLPIGLLFLVDAVRDRRLPRERVVFVGAALVTAALFVSLPLVYFDDTALWHDYFERISMTMREKFYPNQRSLRDVFLQLGTAPFPFSISPAPGNTQASLPEIFIDDHRVAFVVCQVLFLGAIVAAALRHPRRIGFALGPLAVFALLVTNLYYWQIFGLAALVLAPTYRENRTHLAALLFFCLTSMISFVVEHVGGLGGQNGFIGSWALFWATVAWVGVEGRRAWKGRRAPDAPDAGEADRNIAR